MTRKEGALYVSSFINNDRAVRVACPSPVEPGVWYDVVAGSLDEVCVEGFHSGGTLLPQLTWRSVVAVQGRLCGRVCEREVLELGRCTT